MRRLVPLLIVLLVAGLFWWTHETEPRSPYLELDGHARRCRDNLLAIHDGLRAYTERHGRPPEASGVGFLAALVAGGVWENTPASVERLTCPGPNARPVAPGTDYADPATLGPDASAYAGPDLEARPLLRFPAGGEELRAIVACDDAAGMNHPGLLNVLYTDRTVRTWELGKLIADGVLQAGATTIEVGPRSRLADLRSLVPDP